MPDETHAELEPDPDHLVIGPDQQDDEDAAPLRAKVVTGLVGIVVLFASGWLLLRVSSPAIAPDQTAPAGHYPLSCPLCHSVSGDVPAKGVQ